MQHFRSLDRVQLEGVWLTIGSFDGVHQGHQEIIRKLTAEARAHGADAILVILSCTDDALALDLTQTAISLGMDALIETHDAEEIDRALTLPSPLIGINNRDLKIMRTDLATSETLSKRIPADRDFISESGISQPEDISRLRKIGARRFLIGESLMKRPDREQHVKTLRQAQ
jgi:indole-3-glycerol phosphate synthase